MVLGVQLQFSQQSHSKDIMVFSYQGFELFNAINRNNICGVKYIFIKEKLKWLIG